MAQFDTHASVSYIISTGSGTSLIDGLKDGVTYNLRGLSAGAGMSLAVVGSDIEISGGGLTDTISFYAASSSGGAADVLNTVTIVGGIITSWTQGALGTPGEWQFDDAANSGHALMATWD